MSLLTPVKVPVNVYRSSDVSAPVLDKKANCIAKILKACLVTGYGTKPSAGWTLAFEDLATKTKVFNVSSMTAEPLYLRIYNDTGQTMGVQLAKGAIDANTVTPLAECDTVFKYLGGITTGEWMVIASDKGVWFFAQVDANYKPSNRSGAYLFAGIVPGTIGDGFAISHTGGKRGDTSAARIGITATFKNYSSSTGVYTSIAGIDEGATRTAVYNISSGLTNNAFLESMFLGHTNASSVALATPLYAVGAGDVYQLPIYSSSRSDLNNFDVITLGNGDVMANFCTSMQYAENGINSYVPTNLWTY